MVTEPCVSLHSLYRNDIHDEGCSALAAALKECRQLQILTYEVIVILQKTCFMLAMRGTYRK